MKFAKLRKNIAALAALTAMFWAMGGISSAEANLDRNDEIQNVMGDLSALTTAAQMYYSDSGNSQSTPPISRILSYFDEGSLPGDATWLYAIKGGDRGWYVGYRAYGMRSDTYRQLEENANTLGIFGDDLNYPWRRGSSHIWTKAVTFGGLSGPSSPTAISRSSDSSVDAATVLLGAALFLSIIRHDHRHHYYSHPSYNWRWRSSLSYHPRYRDRFYGRYYRPVPTFRPAPYYAAAPRLLAPPPPRPPVRAIAAPPPRLPVRAVAAPPPRLPVRAIAAPPPQPGRPIAAPPAQAMPRVAPPQQPAPRIAQPQPQPPQLQQQLQPQQQAPRIAPQPQRQQPAPRQQMAPQPRQQHHESPRQGPPPDRRDQRNRRS